MLQITYFRAELVQLIVSQNDLELEVQTYGIKKNSSSLWLLILSCLKMNRKWDNEKNCPKTENSFYENWTAKTDFSVFEFEVSSVRFLENWYPTFSLGSAHPYMTDTF